MLPLQTKNDGLTLKETTAMWFKLCDFYLLFSPEWLESRSISRPEENLRGKVRVEQKSATLLGVICLIPNDSRSRVLIELRGWLCCSGYVGLVASVKRWMHGPALTRLPRHLHPAGWCPSQEPDGLGAWNRGDRRFQGNLHTCSFSRDAPELRVLQPAQPWWSLASDTLQRHCCYRPDCPLLSAAVRVSRECILLQDHKCTNIAEGRQCRI